MTPYYAINVFRLTYRRRKTFTGSARVTCAAATSDRFLISGCASYLLFRPIHYIIIYRLSGRFVSKKRKTCDSRSDPYFCRGMEVSGSHCTIRSRLGSIPLFSHVVTKF